MTQGCCCGGSSEPAEQPASRPSGPVPVRPTDARLTWRDRLGAWRVRWGFGRMDYRVEPGLYALGSPGPDSEVLVTANYKLTFDVLRRALTGLDVWIVVLDTKGINVWCAAGKGTFGTAELVHRLAEVRLSEVVAHHHIILPQLGAPGVAAHRVKEESGFRVVYGPIRAADIPEFLAARRRATPAMRRKNFPLRERVVLIPIELVGALKVALPAGVLLYFLSGLGAPGGYWEGVRHSGLLSAASLGLGLLAGAVLVPVLLPWLPGRAFSLKGMVAALLLTLPVALFWIQGARDRFHLFEAGSWVLMATALAAFLAMNFTGASTFTSLSGVKREMRIAVPLQLGAAAIGVLLWAAARFPGGISL
jgi:hypothetical protein